jgi:hypothetical protein
MNKKRQRNTLQVKVFYHLFASNSPFFPVKQRRTVRSEMPFKWYFTKGKEEKK